MRQKSLCNPIHTGVLISQTGNSFKSTKVLKVQSFSQIRKQMLALSLDTFGLSKLGQTGLAWIHSGGERRTFVWSKAWISTLTRAGLLITACRGIDLKC